MRCGNHLRPALQVHSWLPIAIALLICTGLLPVLVQAQNPRGTLRGEVQDLSGARIAGARVVAQSTGSSLSKEGQTDERGEFRIEGLLPGTYHVVVTARGFADAASDLEVVVSMVRDVTVKAAGKDWNDDVKDAVRDGRVTDNMTREQVELAWGWPRTTLRSTVHCSSGRHYRSAR